MLMGMLIKDDRFLAKGGLSVVVEVTLISCGTSVAYSIYSYYKCIVCVKYLKVKNDAIFNVTCLRVVHSIVCIQESVCCRFEHDM